MSLKPISEEIIGIQIPENISMVFIETINSNKTKLNLHAEIIKDSNLINHLEKAVRENSYEDE